MPIAPTTVEQVGVEIGERLREERTRLGYNQASFAKAAGVAKTTQFNYESGGRSPDALYLHAAMRLGVDLSYLLTGARAGAQREEFVSIPLGPPPSMWQDGDLREPEAFYRVHGMSVSLDWLQKKGLLGHSLAVINVTGHGMKGVLSDGDKVLVDQEDHTPRSGFIYVLRQGLEYAVNYCQMMPGGMLRVSSASPSFPPYDVDLNTAKDFNIVGRVVASMHEW